MSAFETAKKFFVACESSEGWEGCKSYVSGKGAFRAQAEPLAGVDTIEAYCDWMAGIGKITLPGATYDLHSSSYDEANKTAIFFATFHARHTGEGGPVPATNKETHTDYVYVLKMNAENKIESMVKVWNASWALRELGWM